MALSAGAPAIAPNWTLDLMAKHSIDFWLTSEDLPDPDNPNYGPKRLIAKLEKLMQKQTKCPEHGRQCHQGLFSRNLFVGQRIPLAGVAHQNGTIRLGHDPKTSALDASFFPSSGAVNPADFDRSLRDAKVEFVSAGIITLPDSAPGFNTGFLVRDTDGHLLRVTQP